MKTRVSLKYFVSYCRLLLKNEKIEITKSVKQMFQKNHKILTKFPSKTDYKNLYFPYVQNNAQF